MNWITDLLSGTGATPAVAAGHTLLILGLVAALGLQLGHIRVYGVSLGVAGVLFVGLVFGHFGSKFDPNFWSSPATSGLFSSFTQSVCRLAPALFRLCASRVCP